jgi:hypothetical protein
MSDALGVAAEGRIKPEERTARWRGMVEQWQKSGQSRTAFSREHGVSLWQMHYWIKKFATPSAGGSTDTAGFVQVTAPATGGSGVVLRLRSGVEVELQPGFDAGTLKRFLDLVMVPC